MKTLKKEIVTKYGCYDFQQEVVVTMAKKVWSIHEDDHDFHVSHEFGEYKTRKQALKSMQADEEWARRMGDNKYFRVVQTEKIIVKRFKIDLAKRTQRAINLRKQTEKDYSTAKCGGVWYSWDGTIIDFVYGNINELMEFGENIYGGHSFVFKDIYGDIYRYKSVLKIQAEGENL